VVCTSVCGAESLGSIPGASAMEELEYITDGKRHLICRPYSIENLHRMADELNIKRCWFHKNHYDIPKKRLYEIEKKSIMVSSKELVRIINGQSLL
jgi:hypothetical protein